MKKILFFEGAGCVPRGEVENCRIRTAFHNDEGRAIYLELTGMERNKYTAKWMPNYQYIGFVDFCHFITEGTDDCNESRVYIVPEGISVERNKRFEYTKQGILNFVNETLCCSFDEIKILDRFDGYFVHEDRKPHTCELDWHNFIEDFDYNPELSQKVRENFKRLDEEGKHRLGSQYSVMSYIGHDDKAIQIRFYASNEAMKKANLGVKRNYTLKFGESLPVI